jgi:hypothetical protein
MTTANTYRNPYLDKNNIRVFDIESEDSNFVWHMDHEDRRIKILEGDGWQFQWDGCLPWLLKPGMEFNIKKNEYHRLIKGVNDLKIEITILNK